MIFFLVLGAIVVGCILLGKAHNKKLAAMTPEQKADYDRQLETRRKALAASKTQNAYGPLNPAMICPHCQTKGLIRTKPVKQKKGISGAKATGAVMTLGVSMLATGLSRKEAHTQVHCSHCGNTWFI